MIKSIFAGTPDVFQLNSSTGSLRIKSKWTNVDSSSTAMMINMTVATKHKKSRIFQLLLFMWRPSQQLRFASAIFSRALDENNAAGLFLFKLRVLSQSSKNDKIRFYIIAGNHGNHFELNANSGKITIRDSLDFEQIPQGNFKLHVYAVNLLNSQTARTEVWVQINNVNDNAPQFQNGGFSEVWVTENEANRLVAQIKAVDLDVNDNVT